MHGFAVPKPYIDMIHSSVSPQEANFSWPCKEQHSWLAIKRFSQTASYSTVYHSAQSLISKEMRRKDWAWRAAIKLLISSMSN